MYLLSIHLQQDDIEWQYPRPQRLAALFFQANESEKAKLID